MKINEKLKIVHLGPIDRLEVESSALTILIGPQASGKSLVAQLFYFFRNLPSLLKRVYHPGIKDDPQWKENTLKLLLDDLRGVPFGYFANKDASVEYWAGDVHWGFSVNYQNRRIRFGKNEAGQALSEWMEKSVEQWTRTPDTLGQTDKEYNIYIPTERSMYTRLVNHQPEVLFARFQPAPFRSFANYMASAQDLYDRLQKDIETVKIPPDESPLNALARMLSPADPIRTIINLQRSALNGTAYLPKRGTKLWKWRVWKEKSRRWGKILPLESVASGQMEAWPFFVLATVFSMHKDCNFYFEEPETHLHPSAQVDVIKAVSLLVNLKKGVLITTHSPFVLMVFNNFLEAFSLNDNYALNPAMVRAYKMPDGTALLDEKTGLISAEEFESIADELGGQFEELLERNQK